MGFKLDSLLKLSDTRARNNKMTLMHYLCKVDAHISLISIIPECTFVLEVHKTVYPVSFLVCYFKMNLCKFSLLLFSLLVKKCQSCWILLMTLFTWKLPRRYPFYSCLLCYALLLVLAFSLLGSEIAD